MRLSVVDRPNRVLAQRLAWRRRTVCATLIFTIFSVAAGQTPVAMADPVDNFKNAVATARSGSSCGPFHYNAIAEQVANVSLRSLVDYIKHTATRVPVEDPLPGLKTLGFPGQKAKLLSGTAESDADSIKGVLLEGSIPPASTIDTPKPVTPHPPPLTDCSYTDFGVSMQRDETTGYYLSALVLAG